MQRLTGKIALITGGNSGIGLATAQQFVHEGAYVFITGRRAPALAAAVQQIGKNVTGVQGDVTKPEDMDRLFARIQQEKGQLEASITASATFGHSASPDNVTCWHIMALQ
jgi:NAD(P)-dependent dehydrogenase (short-subunit alcohol dehydrogenase family)